MCLPPDDRTALVGTAWAADQAHRTVGDPRFARALKQLTPRDVESAFCVSGYDALGVLVVALVLRSAPRSAAWHTIRWPCTRLHGSTSRCLVLLMVVVSHIIGERCLPEDMKCHYRSIRFRDSGCSSRPGRVNPLACSTSRCSSFGGQHG